MTSGGGARVWPAAARPGLLARLSPAGARAALAVLPVAVLVGLAAPAAPTADAAAEVVQAVRYGGDLYQSAAEVVRSGGADAWSMPMPAVPLLVAPLPGWLGGALLWVVAGAALLCLQARVAPLFRDRRGALLAGALIALGLAGIVGPGAADRPEAWAGVLVALSMGLAAERPVEAAAAGLAAACASAVAMPYLLVSAVLAAGATGRGALPWVLALVLAAAVTAGHMAAMAQMVPLSWHDGPDMARAVAVPAVLGLAALGLPALWAWSTRPEPVARHLWATVLACTAAALLIDLPFGVGLALLPAGLALLPAALADGWPAASARSRRITVRRVDR